MSFYSIIIVVIVIIFFVIVMIAFCGEKSAPFTWSLVRFSIAVSQCVTALRQAEELVQFDLSMRRGLLEDLFAHLCVIIIWIYSHNMKNVRYY